MSDQSPWGNRPQNNKNPDDFIKEGLNKLKDMFFGAPPPKNGQNPKSGPNKPENKFPVFLLVIAGAIIFASFNAFYQIQPGERGVVTRFGKYNRTLMSGLNFIIPFIEDLYKINVEIIRKEEFGFSKNSGFSNSREVTNDESLMLTGDRNVINLNWVVQYRITSPENYLFNIRDVSQTVRDVSETTIRRLVGNRDFDYVLDNREELAFSTKSEMQEFLDKYKSGVALEAVQLLDVTPPDPVRPSFNEVNEADQDKTRLINEAQKEFNEKIPKARGQAKRVIEEAEGYRLRRINEAIGEVSRFNDIYAEYRQYKTVTRQRLYLETLQEVLPNAKEILVTDKDQNVMPLLNMSGGNLNLQTNPKN